MSNFGDIRSAIHAQDMHALHDAMRQYRDPSTPVDVAAKYAIDAALKRDWSIPLCYRPHGHPLKVYHPDQRIKCYIRMNGYKGPCLIAISPATIKKWLLAWVIKPMRIWCDNEEQHALWDRLETFHNEKIRLSGYANTGLWNDAKEAFEDHPKSSWLARMANGTAPPEVCLCFRNLVTDDRVQQAHITDLLRHSFDQWVLHHFLNPTS